MSDCTSFEINIERQRRDALDPEAMAALRVHLEGCAACRAYDADSSGEQLRALVGPPPDAAALLESVQRQAGVLRRSVAWAIAGAAVNLFALGWFAIQGAGDRPGVVFGGLGISAAAMIWAAWKLSREARSADRAAGEGELLAVWRASLDERIQIARIGGPAVSLGAFALLGGALLVAGIDNPKVLFILAMALGVTGFAAWQRLVELPRLVRERDGLDRA